MYYQSDELIEKFGPAMLHFLACDPGSGVGEATLTNASLGRLGGKWLKCLNSENSSKPFQWAGKLPTLDFYKTNGLMTWVGHERADLNGFGNEYCPDDCVDDCASFKWGSFDTCGATGANKWEGYNGGASKAVGPNPMCREGVVTVSNGMVSRMWCGPKPPPKETCKRLRAQSKEAKTTLKSDAASKATIKALREQLKAAKAARKAAKKIINDNKDTLSRCRR